MAAKTHAHMSFCEQCGSTSRDKDGFCRGCGKPWPVPSPAGDAEHSGAKPGSPLAELPAKISFIGIEEVRPKKVWAAVLLALMLGPFGLLYCSMTGAIVMTLATILLGLVLGNTGLLIVLPICAIWAWRAARESTSFLD